MLFQDRKNMLAVGLIMDEEEGDDNQEIILEEEGLVIVADQEMREDLTTQDHHMGITDHQDRKETDQHMEDEKEDHTTTKDHHMDQIDSRRECHRDLLVLHRDLRTVDEKEDRTTMTDHHMVRERRSHMEQVNLNEKREDIRNL